MLLSSLCVAGARFNAGLTSMTTPRRLTAIFEDWLLGDGCYPPLHRDQLVNLAFMIESTDLHREHVGESTFESREDATCRLHGIVTWVDSTRSTPIVALEADGFRCYVESSKVAGWQPGMGVAVEGTLLLDYYIWTEFVIERYPDAPDLFYPLRVTRIRRAYVPETTIVRGERSVASPTSVPLDEVAAEDLQEVETMVDEQDSEVDADESSALAVYRPAFFLVDFTDDGLLTRQIPRTFR
jgi:hypothetical protein